MRFITFYEANVKELRGETDPKRKTRSVPVKSEYLGIDKFGIINFRSTAVTTDGRDYWKQELKPIGKIDPNLSLKEFRTIFNGDIQVNCDCKDFQYRMAYKATKQNYILGKKEIRPSKITNPSPSFPEGGNCKHIENVLSIVKANLPKIYSEYKRLQ